MSGPIVRSAPNKKFTQNWEAAFGGRRPAAKASAASKKPRKKAAKKKKA